MNDEKLKKDMIIKEISFWKKNHLLPEHYCDFLTQLYTEGQSISEEREEILAQQSFLESERKSKKNMPLIINSFIFFLVLVAFVFLFISKLLLVPLVFSILILAVLVIRVMKVPQSDLLMRTLLHVSIALLIFAITVRMSTVVAEGSIYALLIVICLNCMLWIIAGIKIRKVYFIVSGIVGIFITIGYYIYM